jgi:hypothetical protein
MNGKCTCGKTWTRIYEFDGCQPAGYCSSCKKFYKIGVHTHKIIMPVKTKKRIVK